MVGILRRNDCIDKKTQKTLFSSDKNYWETPQSFFERLNEKYHFTLDVAASHENHKCDRYFTEEDDGLSQDWGGEIVFCNPPYGSKETGVWTKKCFEEAQKLDTTVVLLIPARTDRHSFHDYIYNKPGVTTSFLPGRLAFEINGEPIRDEKGSVMKAPFPSMLVEFKKEMNEHFEVAADEKIKPAPQYVWTDWLEGYDEIFGSHFYKTNGKKVRVKWNGFKSTAMCHPTDAFELESGRAIALGRAYLKYALAEYGHSKV